MGEDAAKGDVGLSADDVVLLRLLARGVSGAELAERLDITPRTVQRRISRVKSHFGVRTTVQAVVAAVRDEVI